MDDVESVHWAIAFGVAAIGFSVGVGLIAGAIAFG